MHRNTVIIMILFPLGQRIKRNFVSSSSEVQELLSFPKILMIKEKSLMY